MKLEKYTDEITTHFKDNGIEYIKFNALDKYSDKISHIITLRHGGVSKFPVETLNFRTVGNDDIKNVENNLEKTCKCLNITFDEVFKGKQAHTDNVLILSNENKDKYSFKNYSDEEVDGYIVSCKDIATLVTTADCNPIIIYDTKNNVYANVHSGWKGTLKRIYIKAIKSMQENFNSNIKDLIVCIGPSIRKCCFSSEEEEFRKKFKDVFKNENEYLEYEENGKRFHIDLIKIITSDLISIGIDIKNINVANICTCCNSDDFYSYRIATQKKYNDYGVMATMVKLK